MAGDCGRQPGIGVAWDDKGLWGAAGDCRGRPGISKDGRGRRGTAGDYTSDVS